MGERYILGNRNLSLRDIFDILSGLTGVKAPRIKLPWQAILPLAHVNRWIADYLTHRPPRIPLEGVRMAKYKMFFNPAKAIRELGLPQTPPRQALADAVTWFRQNGYVKSQ